MFAARNSNKFDEMSSLEKLGKPKRNLRDSYKFIGNFIKKETLTQVFHVNFEEFLRTPFYKELFWWLLLLM